MKIKSKFLKGSFLFVLFCFWPYTFTLAQNHGAPPAAELHFLNGKTSTVIPFERHRDWIMLKVKVNDTKTLSFIFDTGAPIAVLTDTSVAKDLNLAIRGNVMMQGAGSEKAKSVPLAGGVKFTLGDLEISNGTMAVGLSDDILPGIDGVIGKCIFENAVVSINWKDSTFTITQKDAYKFAATDKFLPLKMMRSGHISTDITVERNGQKIPTRAVLDLGNKSTFFIDKTTAQPMLAAGKTIPNIITGWGASGSVTGDIGRTNLSIGEFEIKDVVTTFRNEDRMRLEDVHANVGLSILEKFDIIFDCPRERFVLRKNAAFPAPFLFNQTGIISSPKRQGNYVIIAGIIPASPAEEAGLKVGDKIVAANGLEPELKNMPRLEKIITGKSVDSVELAIEREGGTIKKKLTSRPLI